jgi:hypothetical protein
MKSLLFTCCLLALFGQAEAQVPDNAPWCPPGATWTYEHVAMSYSNYYVFRYTGDTVIQGMTAKTMAVTNVFYGFAGPNGQGAYSGATYRGSEYYRQSGDSIFWWAGGQFQLIYRLNAQVGDRWVVRNPREVCGNYPQYPAQDTIKVRSVRKDTINGRIYDVATARSDSGYYILGYGASNYAEFRGEINSGIGSLQTPYPMLSTEKCVALATGGGSVSDAGRFFRLACYSDNIRGTVNVSFGTSQGCSNIAALATAVSNIKLNEIGIRSWPNPVRESLHLEGVAPRTTYLLTDLSGRVLQRGGLSNGSFSTAALQAGIYLLQVQSRSQSAVLKLLKQ